MTLQNDEQLAAQAIEDGDYLEAARLLRPLAERNSEYALLTLGWLHETGSMDDPDDRTARSYYESAASQGSVAAYLYLGRLFLKSNEHTKARGTFERGAELGDDECKAMLSRLDDYCVEELARKAIEDRLYRDAVRLLRPLAERGSEYALLTLGWIHETGVADTLDYAAARSYYLRAIDQGSVGAFLDLGRTYLREGNASQARKEFQDGARRGEIGCMSELGRMMIEGAGGPVDGPAGYGWLEQAASNGHLFAQRTLLAVEEQNAKSLVQKLSVKKKIAQLATKMAKETLRDPYSDKLR